MQTLDDDLRKFSEIFLDGVSFALSNGEIEVPKGADELETVPYDSTSNLVLKETLEEFSDSKTRCIIQNTIENYICDLFDDEFESGTLSDTDVLLWMSSLFAINPQHSHVDTI